MKINRTTPPKIKDEINFSSPKLTKKFLDDNIPVYFTEKNSLPIIQINLIVNSGSITDPEDKQGLTNLLAITIDEGANGLSSLEIDNRLEALGTLFSISVEPETTLFSMMTLKKNLEESLEILSWVLQKPNFDESDFLREKSRIIDEVKRLKDNPAFVADYFITKNLFQDSPFSYLNIGFAKTLQNITLDDVKQHYENHFSSKNISVVAVGNLSAEEFTASMNKFFYDFNINSSIRKIDVNLSNQKRHFHLVNKKGAPQSEIRIGNISSGRFSTDYFSNKLANSILGGQFSSRLNHNLREVKGITYGVHTYFKYTKKFGSFQASTAVDTKNSVVAIKEFFKEFDLIRNSVTEDEIAFAKSYLRKTFPLQFSSYSKIASNNTNLIAFNLPYDYYDSYLSNIESVTKEGIITAARKNILPENQQVVIVGDVEKFQDEIMQIDGENSVTRYEIDDLEI